MPVSCLPADKPKIVFYGAMMAIQNYGFYAMYYPLFLAVPDNPKCDEMRFWLGTFSIDCFIEAFVVLWMAMGGYIEDNFWFKFGWIMHLLVALPYCVSTVAIPLAIFSDDGEDCRGEMGNMGYSMVAVYWTHCTLFLVYVWMMLSITYYSFAKATFFKSSIEVS